MATIPTTLRIEEQLKKELDMIALEEQRSLNNLINWILTKWLENKKSSN